MISELNKILTIIENAKVVQHLETAERVMNAFVRKWQLSTPKTSNAICDSVYEEIMLKRNEMLLEDAENAGRV